MALTVVIPTLARPSLYWTIDSFAGQLKQDDAVVVILDSPDGYEFVKDVIEEYGDAYPDSDWMFFQTSEQLGYWGHGAANLALGTYVDADSWVWRLDDDDIAAEGALDALRSAQDAPWAVFRMTFGPGHYASGMTIWREPKLRHGDVGTPMFFAPLCGARFGLEYSGDFVYAQALEALLGPPVFREEVVCVVRPEIQEEAA